MKRSSLENANNNCNVTDETENIFVPKRGFCENSNKQDVSISGQVVKIVSLKVKLWL